MKFFFINRFGAWLQFSPLLVLVTVALFTQTQCTTPPNETPDNATVTERNEDEAWESTFEYYLDGESVESIEVETGVDNWIVGLSLPIEGSNNGLLKVYKFTKKEDYIQFGHDNGINLELELNIGAHLKHVADSSGVIRYYEETGKIPEWYTRYEAEYIASQQFGGSATDRALFILYRECYNGNAWLGLTTYPVMPPSWNNEVSSFEAVAFGAIFSIYDRAFYFDRMITWVNLGFDRQRLCNTPFNNRTSSCIIL